MMNEITTPETDTKAEDKRLTDSEKTFRSFRQNMDVVFWVADNTYNTLYISPAYEKIWGRTCESIYENPMSWMDSIHPDDREKVTPLSYDEYKEKNSRQFEFRIHRPDGSWRWISNKTFLIEGSEDGTYQHCGISTDITEQKTLELRLKQSEEDYETLLAASPVGVFKCDADGNCYYANDRLSQLLGQPKASMMQKGWMTSVHPDDLGPMYAKWEQCVDEERPYEFECRYLHKDDSIVWVYIQIIAEFNKEKKSTSYLGTATEITSLRVLEAKHRKHQSEYAHLARLNTAGEMLSGIAHELNQPLAAISQYLSGSIHIVEQQQQPETSIILPALKKAQKQALRAGKMIHQYKNFLKKDCLNYEKTDLNDLIDDAINLVGHELNLENIELHRSFGATLPAVLADKIQIEQVILNLLNNAVDAMKTDSISTNHRKITITTRVLCSKTIEVSIQDSGIGLNSNNIGKFFNPFVTTKEKGMGIGLSISKEIIHKHGGTLSGRNCDTGGAEFTFTLPIFLNEE